MTRSQGENLVKVYFECAEPAESTGATESLWARPLTDSPNCSAFELRNSPFAAYGVSFLDIVKATKRSDGEGYDFAGVIDRSGHSTYRIRFPKDASPQMTGEFANNWSALEKLGCTYESSSVGDDMLYVVDVPSQTNVHDIYKILDEAERAGVWVFEEAHCGHRV